MVNQPNTTLTRLTLFFPLFLLVAALNSSYAQAPVANFTANTTSGCAPLTVVFTDQSTGNPFSWTWDFGNGQLSTARNPAVSYSQPGTYTVRLVVRNASGIDEEIKTDYITVAPSPQVSFSANINTACVPATIQFTDQTTVPPGGGTITSWAWDFGDGGSSTLQNPSHTYTATGFYTVSLRVTSSTGCQGFAAVGRYIRIVDGVAADFTFTQPGTCQPPFVINFQDQSSGPGSFTWSWNFGNGGPGSTLQNPSATYAAPGTYSVQLTVQSSLGCNGTITKNITINGKTTDFTAPANACIGQSITFQNASSPPPVSSTWDFGDGTGSSQISPVKTYFTAGTFHVKLVNNYGNCSDSITKTITVSNLANAAFTANDSTSCRAPFTVQFSDMSPGAATWLWDFGDGGTSTQQNPSHTYTSTGIYDVTLTITLPGGCTNTITKSQYIKVQPTVVAIANAPAGGCAPYTFNPIPSVQTVDSIISYSWDLGEPGAIYTTQFPSHTYNSTGNYTISLTVTTQGGCTETITIPDGVRTGTLPAVNFSFTPDSSCASTPIQFTDLSVTSPVPFVNCQWDFGYGMMSTAQHPAHKYVDTGALVVKLIVSNNGCRDSLTKPIQVRPPVAIFDYTVDCNNRLETTFLDSSLVDPAYGAITYEWRMGDPANTVFFGLPPPTFTYPAYGTYTARLIVTNGPCSYDTSRQVILMNEPVAFTINKNPVCKGEVFTLRAINSDSTKIARYTWTIDTITLTDSTRSVNYSLFTYGTYDVTLMITDINGCTSSVTIPDFITVAGPVASFVPNGPGGCVNTAISFTDQSTPAGTITEWKWNFGDGSQQIFTSPPFTHTYTLTGSYSVNLMIKDGGNCSDTFSIPNAVVITSPVAAFRADTFYCPQAPLQFIDTSSGSGLTHSWNFGDGGTSTLQNPTHSYPLGNNSYTVTLRIRDFVGCEDSITKTQYIKIRSPQSAFAIQDSAGVCVPLVTTFTFQGSDYQSFYWDFGDGGTSTAMNPSHFYNFYGTYTPKLYVLGPGGCVDSSEATVNVYDPANMQIQFSPDTSCNSATVNFTITTPPNFRFNFFFGDGQIDSSQQHSLTHFYPTPGIYYPYIIVYDRFGCESGRVGQPVVVWGAIPLFSKDKSAFCDNGEVFFVNYTVTNDPIILTTWDFGDGTTTNQEDPISHIYSSPGTYIVRLNVLTQNQCTSTFTDTIRVYGTPDLSILGKDTICVNLAERFEGLLTYPDSTIAWQWSLGNGSSSLLQNPDVTYTTPGDYTIQLIAANKLGCADSAVHSVHVVALPTAAPVTNPLTIISGGSAQLNMNYTGPISSYTWTPTQHLDCTNCPIPVANPQFSTKYSVAVEDRYGCQNTADIMVNVVCTGQNFFIPNTFSPNGDGSNDIFYPRGTGLFRIKTLRVFNRWGEVVFEKREVPVNDPSYGWNGNYKGKKAQPDVYVYQVEILCNNGELIKYAGNIALIL